jgi:parvulin-like peptidyl-prolyl isomerase
MRMLVQNQVQVTPDALQQAYRLTYGEKYHARVITVPTLADANRLRGLLAAGEADFAHLAVTRSTDPSAVQGGLLPPISPADPAFPAVIREALVRLDEQGRTLSDVIAVDNGYALLKLERKTTPEAVEFADVKDELAEQVRRSAERVLMQQLARELLAEADVVVLDPALQQSWERQSDAMLRP